MADFTRWARRRFTAPWNDRSPVREALFGVERLEQHAESLAAAQSITDRPPVVLSLHTRLNDNAAVLLAAYRGSAAELENGRSVVPAAEWLLDNYHLVEAQIREIRDDLPPGFYRQLPKLASGPFAGYPRVFGLAWAFVAHTDSHVDPEILRRFIAAYQRVQPLTIGELWAVAITLRIVLIENLRRLADQITAGRQARAAAEALANRLFAVARSSPAAGSGAAAASATGSLDNSITALQRDIATRATEPASEPLSEPFAAQLAKRFRDQDPRTTPALGWLEERLHQQHSSIEEVVQHAQQRQGASNVSVRNVITSMRLISDIDWAELFESVSLVDARLRAGSGFAAMDFTTRNLYRSAIEQLSRGSQTTELEIADLALQAAAAARLAGSADTRMLDPGYYLIAEGRQTLERQIGFRPPVRLRFSRFNIRLGIGGYLGSILLLSLLALAWSCWLLSGNGVTSEWLALFAVLAFVPATEMATALVNRAITASFGAMPLPGLELLSGVPEALRTLVAVPTLLTSEADLLEQIERLEVHHLSGVGGDLVFALLTDGLDADQEVVDSDAPLLAIATAAIAALNRRHGPSPSGERFLLLHRRRLFNPSENRWMGWERKRGKLHELNRLLRGATDTSYIVEGEGVSRVPPGVRYVITLDADTRLPRDTAQALIGKMAHPLNQPRFSASEQRVVDGYAILQPRVTPSLPVGREGSLYQRVFSGPGGLDPYAAAVSDVYQDLFGEGSYTGKGIYDIDAFETALHGRVPDNTLLSHDLFEGVFARAGLASDVEVVEESPARYDVVARRQHRWTRGDWQLLPWIFGNRRGGGRAADGIDNRRVPPIGRIKMLDNLRRSLLAPTSLLGFALCWLLPWQAGLEGALLILAALLIPVFLPSVLSMFPRRTDIRLRNHVNTLGNDVRLGALQIVLTLALLPDQAWRMIDAIVRTLFRLGVSRRHLLEWTTAAQTSGQPRLDVRGFYRAMAGGTLLGLLMNLAAVSFFPASWALALPFALLWLAAPALAWWTSRAPSQAGQQALSDNAARELRLIARRTWRFFETFVTAAEHHLPPDNFQEDPKPVVAHRTSPTNIGLYMLAAIAARDFGWSGLTETVERLEATFESLLKLPRFKGHFFNWYGTLDLQALTPAYVSSVDSGNLAGHLIVVATTCEEWLELSSEPRLRVGLADNLLLAREALAAWPAASDGHGQTLAAALDEIDVQMNGAQSFEAIAPTLKRLAEKAEKAAQNMLPLIDGAAAPELLCWIEAFRRAVAEHERDRQQIAETPGLLHYRLKSLADTARAMAMGMDFAFLLDPERKLMSIGYSMVENRLDPSCYDLLASEARLASLFAIAKGDVATRHWFRLGRVATPVGNGSALISWSGSMFEYLMPSLVMRAPLGSLLEQTNRLVVQRQQEYGRTLGTPWGISESAYNARDMEFTYQYSNFGVPGLGLKRGLSENAVIAPYATGLATMVAPQAAHQNYARLAEMGAYGRYGFYEALDFTRARLPENASVAIVRSFMAHHQGMTLVAIANTLQGARMRERFHREPIIQASEILLQERMPRDVAVAHPRAEEVKTSAADASVAASTLRRLSPLPDGAPVTHLLSNGRYAVMLTATGGGYSRWRDLAITRWREDATRDDWGSFIFLRDTRSGHVWSAGAQPLGVDAEHQEVVFGEDHAAFTRHDGSLTTVMDVLVSGEIDGEVRRVSLANRGRRTREIELTSYAELVLTTPATDNAHPVFSKMFVQTEHLPEFGALLATRRPRTPHEPSVWAAHFAVVESEVVADPQYESDRARFIGRGHRIDNAAVVLDGAPLSNTVGTVLDPIFSIRQRVSIEPGRVARVAFWTVVADSREELLDLIDKQHDRSAFDRAKTLAWTQAQVQLRHLDIEPEEAADFQRLAAPILYADRRFRAPSEAIIRGAGPQSALWAHAISGDLPIVLLRIDEMEDIAQVRQLLRAHEYWRMKRLAVDLVIVNERVSSYIQDLQIAIETAVRISQSRPSFGTELAQGSIHTLRADLVSLEARALLRAIARIDLSARRGAITDQLARLPASIGRVPSRRTPAGAVTAPVTITSGMRRQLEFFNGLGGFARNGAEYVTVLDATHITPAPWINVIANPNFGFQVSTEGSGYTWAENSRENQLTPWSNDPVVDPAGEALYVRDENSGELFAATAAPLRDGGTYVARHGFGYSRFEHQVAGLALELLQYVPLHDPVKISRLTLRNLSSAPRRLSITAYTEWVLGTSRSASGPFIITEIDAATGALLARNPWNNAFPGRVAFADLGGVQQSCTADRTEFLGRHGRAALPAALATGTALSGRVGAGFDPCAALQTSIELAAGESIEIVACLGHCANAEAARALILRYREADLDAVLAEVTGHWQQVLGTVQVKTPERTMDIMLNGWLLYQTLACRIWARSAFYQASGAYGFRDQLQDGMALIFAQPDATRHHLLRAAGRQFVEGDVQHWWLPHSGQGVRTRISDDRVWLAYAAASYISATGDTAILDESVPFLEGPALGAGEHDAFFQPMLADESADLFEHCARGLDQCLLLTGPHGLPLMGTGDWNDGMNRVGEGGTGESVWLGWLLIRTIELFAPLAEAGSPARDPARAARWREHAAAVRQAIESDAWDGDWYRRATFDDGTWLGSKDSDECRIDSIAQSWAVLSGAAEPARAASAMHALDRHLIRRGERLALLFEPPFDHTPHDPGYIKGYPPGLRENGGQYSHAAMWAILALTTMRAVDSGNRASELFNLLNPIHHALTPADVGCYKVEPYVVAADVYSVAPHAGRGGWTWYTGSAGWMYRAGIEGILGLRRAGDELWVDPCLPDAWPGFEALVNVGTSRIDIHVVVLQTDANSGHRPHASDAAYLSASMQPARQARRVSAARLDGVSIPCTGGMARVLLDGRAHQLEVFI